MAKTLFERAVEAADFTVLVPWQRYKADGSIKDSNPKQPETLIHICYYNPVSQIEGNIPCKTVYQAGAMDRWKVFPVLVQHVIDCPVCKAWFINFMAARRTKSEWFNPE